MLVLTRKKQEVIQIGDDITITVLRIKGKTVRLGIEAPMHASVLRGELVGSPPNEANKSASNVPAQKTLELSSP